MPIPTKKSIALCTMLAVVGMMLSYAENLLIPTAFLPGVKIGFSNIVVIFSLFTMKKRHALAVGISKCVLTGLLFSGAVSIIYGTAGIILSVLSMDFLKKRLYPEALSIAGISIVGSALFNAGQIAVASVILKSTAPVYYLGYLLIISAVSGGVSGLITSILMNRLRIK